MIKRARLPLILLIGMLLWATAQILAIPQRGDVDVTANGNNTFTPDAVTIESGQAVNWSNIAGFHNVVADDDSFTSGAPSSSNWMFSHQFNDPGTYGYYCSIHGSAGGGGMSGIVIVVEPVIYLPVVITP